MSEKLLYLPAIAVVRETGFLFILLIRLVNNQRTTRFPIPWNTFFPVYETSELRDDVANLATRYKILQSLLIILLFVVCYLLFAICCLLFVVCYLLFVICCLLFVDCRHQPQSTVWRAVNGG